MVANDCACGRALRSTMALTELSNWAVVMNMLRLRAPASCSAMYGTVERCDF
jgi:hypothetical protein